MDVADEEPVHVYVRCNAPPSWGRPCFQGIIEDADKIETARSPRLDNRFSMVAWLVRQGVGGDRAEWMVDQILRSAVEKDRDGTTDC